MSIDLKTNDYVPGGTYVRAPGNALQAQYIGYEGEGHLLNEGDLVDIIRCWSKRYRDKYQLYIDDYDDIDTADEVDTCAKIILVRCINERWEACCYFAGAGNSTNSSPVNPPTTECTYSQSFAAKEQAQTRDSAARANSKSLNEDTNSLSEAANIVLSTIRELDTAIKELSAAMKTLVVLLKQRILAIEEQNRALEDLRTTVDRIVASMGEAVQVQAQSSSNNVPSDPESMTGSEGDLTPSTQTLSDVNSTGFPW